jgi:hypothetical protein
MLRWAMVGERAIGVGPKGTRWGGPELRHAASAVLACALAVVVGGCAQEADDALLSERGAAGPSSEDVEEIFEDAIAMASDVESAELATSIRFGSERFELVGAWSNDGVGWGSLEIGRGDSTSISELRSDGERAWLSTDGTDLEALVPEGVEWLEAPRDDLADAGILHDPHRVWDLLLFLRGIEAAEHRRNDSVAGDPVRELHGSVDHDLAYDRASPDERAAMDRALSVPVFTHFEADVGIDAMGRVRTLEYDIGSGAEGTDIGFPIALSVLVTSYDPAVEPPPTPDPEATISIDEVPDAVAALRDMLRVDGTEAAATVPDVPIHDPEAAVANGFYPVFAIAAAVAPMDPTSPCTGFDFLMGQHVAGADGQCYGIDLEAGLGIDIVGSAAVADGAVELTFTADGLARLRQLVWACRDHNALCPMAAVAVVADGEVVTAPPGPIASVDGTGAWVWGNFTEEEFAAIAEALTAG